MAEQTKDTKATEAEDTEAKAKAEAQAKEEADAKAKADAEEKDKAPGFVRTSGGGAGDYVVIADQMAVKGAKGYAVHKRGAKVKLNAEQAAVHSAGTRPAVVPASEVKDGNVQAAALASLRKAAQARSKRRR